jgi:hypothetical protein
LQQEIARQLGRQKSGRGVNGVMQRVNDAISGLTIVVQFTMPREIGVGRVGIERSKKLCIMDFRRAGVSWVIVICRRTPSFKWVKLPKCFSRRVRGTVETLDELRRERAQLSAKKRGRSAIHPSPYPSCRE